jgi:hypothetical protein
MTVSTSANKVIVAGNGSQTAFAFSFVGVAAADISVTYTDASGVQTTLVQGPGATQYQVTLNAAVSGALWGVGGTVTYNPSGTPIASGTTLTIVRTVAYTQGVSLQNQSAYGQYAQAAETAIDLLCMEIQQIAEAQGRVISAPIVDPSTINLTLPAAAQRANLALLFDGSGNVIAGQAPAAGTISSAMQPVVNAASLAAGRTAFGLGSIATGTANLGLQTGVTGAGLIDVNFATAQDGGAQNVTSAFHLTQRFATGAISYTLAQANTFWNGFGFWVTALTAAVSIIPNAADNFAGMGSGVTLVLPAGTSAFITTNGANPGTWWARNVRGVGLNSPLNIKLAPSAAGGALTVTLQDANGNTPSTTNPVLIAFRDPTSATGDLQIAAITGALSFVIPSGATFGTANGISFRLWFIAFNNAGTVVLGAIVCVVGGANPTRIAALNESAVVTPTAVSSGSNTAGTFYATSAPAGVAFRVLGYMEFTLGAAGTWAAPSLTQIYGLGIKKPGDIIQSGFNNNGAGTVSQAITPTSAANLVKATSSGFAVIANSAANIGGTVQLKRSGSAIQTVTMLAQGGGSGGNLDTPFAHVQLDNPNTAASVTYSIVGNTVVVGGSSLLVEEIMT